MTQEVKNVVSNRRSQIFTHAFRKLFPPRKARGNYWINETISPQLLENYLRERFYNTIRHIVCNVLICIEKESVQLPWILISIYYGEFGKNINITKYVNWSFQI